MKFLFVVQYSGCKPKRVIAHRNTVVRKIFTVKAETGTQAIERARAQVARNRRLNGLFYPTYTVQGSN